MARSALSTLVQRFKALAHPARLRMTAMLATGELCVCQIVAVLQLAPSTVSAHLATLRRGGLVGQRKDGRWVFYYLEDEGRELLALIQNELAAIPQVAMDAVVVARLRSFSPEDLCRVDLDLGRLGISPVSPLRKA